MKINGATGIGYRDALDYMTREIQKEFELNRHDAQRLFAETLVRNVVWDEIMATAAVLLGKERENGL